VGSLSLGDWTLTLYCNSRLTFQQTLYWFRLALIKAFFCINLWRSSTYKLRTSTIASFVGLPGLVVTRRAWCYPEELVYERWIFGCCSYNGFSEFREWLRVLVVNDVMFSYRSFFSREVLGKQRGLSIFCGASLSLWVEHDIVSSFSKILSTTFCLFSGGLSIYHYIHCVIISRPLLFFQRLTNGHYVGFLHQNIFWRTETQGSMIA
jgi:hypothetical protein